MPATKRATVYFEPPIHRALRLTSAETDATFSALVNATVRRSLAEDADDLAAFRERARGPRAAFESAVRDLKQRGKL